MPIRDSGSPAIRSHLIDADGYYAAKNLEELAKENYEALTTNNPSWAISIGSLDVNAGGITNAGAISGVTTLSMTGNLTVGGTVDGVDVSTFKTTYDTHAGEGDVHHAQEHVLAGGDHTASGLTVGWTLRANGATTFAWAALYHSELYDAPEDAHHAKIHQLTGAEHYESGKTIGHFLKVDGATAFSFQAHGLVASDVGAYTTGEVDSAIDTDISTHTGDDDAHHAPVHALVSGDHTASGLSVGHVIRANGATTFAWTELYHSDLYDAPVDAHHAKWTTLDTEGVITAEIAAGQSIDNAIDALIGAAISDDVYAAGWDADTTHAASKNAIYDQLVTHYADTDEHHPQEHALVGGDHTASGLSIGDVIRANGATTFAWTALYHSDLIGVTSDQHHAEVHQLTGAKHYESGQTIGHFLRADSATTFSFQAHGLVASDVGAYTTGEVDSLLSDHIGVAAAHHAKWTTGDTEGVITAELVNGQSIDLAIDSLISTHNAADTHIAHSGVSIIAGVGLSGGGTIAASRTIDCDITQYTDGLARTACLEDDVYGVGWDADVTHAPTQNAVYDKIAAMDILIAANTTVTEVENIIIAELVDGQSIDLAIDALIAAVVSDDVYAAGWNGVTDVAPSKNAVYDKIQTIGGGGEDLAATLAFGNESDGEDIIIDSAGDLIVYSDNKVTEVARIDGATGNITTIGTIMGIQLQALLMYGSGNKDWVTVVPVSNNEAEFLIYLYIDGRGGGIKNLDCILSKPTSKGALHLYIDDVRFNVTKADDNDFITSVTLYGIRENGTNALIQADTTDHKTTGSKTWSRAGTDVSAYRYVTLRVSCSMASAGGLWFTFPEVECYYA